ncbi:MAG: ABC transporter permease [Betaproteobacteria bacterium RIFCSPLOWO2_12_FULL_67_28]|nr:MAG: ABC transporter permease [Betaproteobacteria bacterium RIFCSPLOWO2_12_FULL_67_28]
MVRLSCLDRKLARDLKRMRGQAFAVAMVIACGLAMMIMARSLIYSLDSTQREYYEAHHFAEVFAQLKRAPQSIAARIREIPGVATVQTGVAARVTLDLADRDEPASGTVRSLPDVGAPELNRLFLRAGRWLAPRSRGELLVGEAFAATNGLHPGDTLTLLLNGRRAQFRVAGIVLSPEYVFESRPGAALPDNRSYGIFWMPYQELASAFDLYGAFNDVALTLAPGATEAAVIAALDQLLRQYGGRGAYGRATHPSHTRVSDEIRILTTLAIGFPLVFLSVAAFMTNAVLSRLLSLQREQIAILKAFGFSNRQIVVHYLKFAFATVAAGTILGAMGGIALGHRLVELYHVLYRFPRLDFRLDESALLLALLVSSGAAAAGVFSAVRRAARLPPAEAMRPQPPASYRPALIERTGLGRLLTHSFRIAMRNLERKPLQAVLTVAGLALATGILVVPNCLRDSVAEILDFQWDSVQRQDISVMLIEPASAEALHHLRQLPGVVAAEPFRSAFVKLHFGQRHRQLGLLGLPPEGLHNRVIGAGHRQIWLKSSGLVVSAKLADVLGAQIGDELLIESLEGKQVMRPVTLVGTSEDFAGSSAYMELQALNQLLGEGDVITGASFAVDARQHNDFLRALKNTPRVSVVAIKQSLRDSFKKTTAASINLLQSIYLVLATVVAFGVVYNNAQVSLAERARELATLRVIGFSRREVGAVLIIELITLAVIAVPLGLLLGTGFATVILQQVNTETVRLPIIFTAQNYAIAALIVTVAAIASALLVLRKLSQLNLIGALRAPE